MPALDSVIEDSPDTVDGRLRVDDLQFDVRRSSRRRTMQITVERNGDLILSAPPHVSDVMLLTFVQGKRFWIYTKLAEKERLRRPVPRKEFVDGEGFLYFGRSCRLKLVAEQEIPLKLIQRRFTLRRDAVKNGRCRILSNGRSGWRSTALTSRDIDVRLLQRGQVTTTRCFVPMQAAAWVVSSARYGKGHTQGGYEGQR
jgi:hypothetical protein